MKYPKNGKFGEFGGQYIPETLVPAIEELEENYLKFKDDRKFKQELDLLSKSVCWKTYSIILCKEFI